MGSIIWYVLNRTYKLWPDALWLRVLYRTKLHRSLNLKNPQRFTEKLQWLKLHDRNPLYSQLVDKYEVKQYVEEKLGQEYLIPTLGVWNHFDEIDFDALPNQFVLKCTHDSGGLCICKDKSVFDKRSAKEKLERSLSNNFYWWTREWPYKNVKPRIIAEKYMVDESGMELKDYKFFCFNGEPRYVQLDFDRFIDHKRNIFNAKWELQDVEIQFPSDYSRFTERPANLDEMLTVARKLAGGFPHVRVDLYNIQGSIFFGELTFYHGGGFEEFRPQMWDNVFGDLLKLPEY